MFSKKNHANLIPGVFSVALRKNPVTAGHVTTCDNELLTTVG